MYGAAAVNSLSIAGLAPATHCAVLHWLAVPLRAHVAVGNDVAVLDLTGLAAAAVEMHTCARATGRRRALTSTARRSRVPAEAARGSGERDSPASLSSSSITGAGRRRILAHSIGRRRAEETKGRKGE